MKEYQKLQPVDEIRLRNLAFLVLLSKMGSVNPPELRVSAAQKYNLNISDYMQFDIPYLICFLIFFLINYTV